MSLLRSAVRCRGLGSTEYLVSSLAAVGVCTCSLDTRWQTFSQQDKSQNSGHLLVKLKLGLDKSGLDKSIASILSLHRQPGSNAGLDPPRRRSRRCLSSTRPSTWNGIVAALQNSVNAKCLMRMSTSMCFNQNARRHTLKFWPAPFPNLSTCMYHEVRKVAFCFFAFPLERRKRKT